MYIFEKKSLKINNVSSHLEVKAYEHVEGSRGYMRAILCTLLFCELKAYLKLNIYIVSPHRDG